MVPRLVYQWEHQQALCQRSRRARVAQQAFVPSRICAVRAFLGGNIAGMRPSANARPWNVARVQRCNSVRSQVVVPVKAGTQRRFVHTTLDPRVRGDDELRDNCM